MLCILTLIMYECKKDETVIESPPSLLLFSGHQTLAGLQCLNSPNVKELEGEIIQKGFRKMVGSARVACVSSVCIAPLQSCTAMIREKIKTGKEKKQNKSSE